MTIDPEQSSVMLLQQLLQHAVAPRPIALVSTIDHRGRVNLSPFSFFNLFSANPPVVVFSPSRRVRDNTTKHTLENLYEVPECVVNMVSYSMLDKVNQSSVEYPKGVNEFEQCGLTAVASESVSPPGVEESPARLECRVSQVLPLGAGPGAGNLVIARIVKAHFKDNLLNSAGELSQDAFDLVARLGGDWYCRVNAENLFRLPKPQ